MVSVFHLSMLQTHKKHRKTKRDRVFKYHTLYPLLSPSIALSSSRLNVKPTHILILKRNHDAILRSSC